MSGVRGTEEFLSVKTQELIIHNPKGGILSVVDGRGSIEPASDLTLSSITAQHINVSDSILQSDINASDISSIVIVTDTITVLGTTTVPLDIFSNNINTNTLNVLEYRSNCLTANTMTTPVLNTQSFSAGDVSSTQITAAAAMNAATITGTNMSITDIQASTVAATQLSSNSLVINDVSCSYAKIHDISGGLAVVGSLKAGDISLNTINVSSMTVLRDLSTNDLNSTGTFTFNTLDLDTLAATRVISDDISTNTVSSANSAIFGMLDVQQFDVSQINISGDFTMNSLQSSSVQVTDLLVGAISTNTIRISGASTVSKNIVTQTTNVSNIITPYMYATNTYNATLMDVSRSLIINSGVITYDASAGLLVSGAPISATQSLYPVPFNSFVPTNNQATLSDISSTLSNFVSSFNSFMDIFSSRALVIILSPQFLLQTSLGMGFILNNAPIQYAPLPTANYSLSAIVSALNAISSPVITFTSQFVVNPLNQKRIWNIRIDVSGGGTTTYIADALNNTSSSSFIPSRSLQTLRWLGFTINDTNNPFETYALSTDGTYRSTIYNISGSYVSSALDITVQYPNRLNAPALTLDLTDPYSIQFQLQDISASNAKYLCVSLNPPNVSPVFTLYPIISSKQKVGNLDSNQLYSINFSYLDDYNQGALNSNNVRTALIPAPVVSKVVTFNTISLSWMQPYPGRTYVFYIEAVGLDINPPSTGYIYDLSYTFFPLHRNTRYVITITSAEATSVNIKGASTIIDVSTNDLIPYPPQISRITGSNASVLVSWPSIVPGSTATLYYSYGPSGIKRLYPDISGNKTSTVITGLGNTGIFSSYLVYTDGNYNTDLSSSTTTFAFDSGFGFGSLIANAALPLILDTPDTLGIGYAPAIGSPWIGYVVNKILLPQGVTEISGNSISFIANAYNIPTSSLTGLYSSPPWKSLVNSLPAPISTSSVYTVNPGATSYPELLFNTTEIILRRDDFTTVILFQKVGGAGTLRFSTFENGPPNPDERPFLTSLTYDDERFMSNGFQTSLYGVVCQFINTISIPVPTYTVVATPYSITLQGLNVAPSQVDSIVVDISGVTYTYPSTQSNIVLSGLVPGTPYAISVTYLNAFYTNTSSAVLSTDPIPPPQTITTTPTINSIRLNWSSRYPSRNYAFVLTASGTGITPPSVQIIATTYSYLNLVQNTPYTISIKTLDTSFNMYSAPVTLNVSTLLLTVPSPSMSRPSNTNVAILFSWTPPVPAGLGGYLFYKLGGAAYTRINITAGTSSYTYSFPTNAAASLPVNSYLEYFDGFNTDVSGNISTSVYDPSFGFYNLAANAPSTLQLTTSVTGIGYILSTANSPWIGYLLDSISFPQGISTTVGTTVAIVANMYRVPTSALSSIYSSPFIAPLTLGTPINTSYTYFLSGTAAPTLVFPSIQQILNPVSTAFSIIILVQLIDGTGSVTFSTFGNGQTPNPNVQAQATAVSFSGGVLSNTFLNAANSGSICQFNWIISPAALSPPLLTNGVQSPDPYSLTYLFSNPPSGFSSFVSLNRILSNRGTANPITLDGLIPNTSYPGINIYYRGSGTPYASSVYAVTPAPQTLPLPAPTGLVASNITYKSFTVSWSPLTFTPPRTSIRYRISTTGTDAQPAVDLTTTTYTFTNLLNGTTYTVNLLAYDADITPNPVSSTTTLPVSTTALTVTIGAVGLSPNSNTSVRIPWSPALSSGLTGTLYYTIAGVPQTPVAITGATTSFDVTGLSTPVDISSVVVYTDGGRNTISSAPVVYSYTPTFGFGNYTPNSANPFVLNNYTSAIGYVLPSGSPWSGYTLNSISFSQGIVETTGNNVAILARVYTVPTTSLAGLYTGGYTATPTLGSPVASSIYFLPAGSTAYPLLTFQSPTIQLQAGTNSTLILISIIDGTGNVLFTTFKNARFPNPDASVFATSVSYAGTTLSNAYRNADGNGLICQFNLITVPTVPATPNISTITATPSSLSYTINNLSTNVSYVSANNNLISQGTLTNITIGGLSLNTPYSLIIYFAGNTAIYATNSITTTASTLAIPPPTNTGGTSTYNTITITWTPPSLPGINIGYLLTGSGVPQGKSYTSPFTFTGLTANSQYNNFNVYSYDVANNNSVATWRDKSGLARNMAASGAVAYVPGLVPSIKLNNSYLFVNTAVNLQSYTVFVVSSCTPAITGGQPVFAAKPSGSNTNSYNNPDSFDIVIDSDTTNKRSRFYPGSTNGSFISNSIPSAGGFAQPMNMMTYACTAAGSATTYVNGAVGNTGSTASARITGAQGFAVGADWQATLWVPTSQANVYEVVAYNSVVTPLQRSAVSLYLGRKWNLPNYTTLPSVITTPTAISSLQVWYDGVDPLGTGVVPYDGAVINTWKNKAGSTYDAVVDTTGVNTPATYSSAFKAIQFNGTNLYNTSYPANPTAETVFMVFNNSDAAKWALLGGQDYGRGVAVGSGSTNVNAAGILNLSRAWEAITPANSYSLGTTGVVVAQVSVTGTTTNTSISLNGGTMYTDSNTGNPYVSGKITYLGQQISGQQFNYAGYAMEILIYNRLLTATEIQQVQNYLTLKWGGSIPSAVPGCQLWLDAADVNTIVTTNDANPGSSAYFSAPASVGTVTTAPFTSLFAPAVKGTTNEYSATQITWTPPLPTGLTGTLSYTSTTGTPQTLFSGCVLWLDGADTSTMTMSGTNITTWRDKSGLGNNATGVGAPQYSASTQGVVFNRNYFTSSTTIPTNNHCLIAVHNPYKTTGGLSTGNTNLFRFNTGGGTIIFPYINLSLTQVGYFSEYGTGVSPLLENSIATAAAPYNVIIANISPTSQKIYNNGVLQSSLGASLTSGTITPLYIGGYPPSSQYYLGAMYEMIVYDAALTDLQIAQISSYLQRKWLNITGHVVGGSVKNATAIIPTGNSSYSFPTVGSANVNCSVVYTDGVNTSSSTTIRRTYVSPMFQQLATHTGVSPFQGLVDTTTGQNPLAWTFQTGGAVWSSPAIGANGMVYIGSNDTYLYALNPNDGTQNWRFTTGDFIYYSSPAVDTNGVVYICSGTTVYAINGTTGTQIWAYSDPTSFFEYSPVIGADGTVYVGATNAILYALTATTGVLKWSYTTNSFISSAAAVGPDGTIYVASGNGTVYAITAPTSGQTGTLKWTYTTSGQIAGSSPAVGPDGTIYIGSKDKSLYAISPNGSKKWSYATGGQIFTSPAIGPDGTIYIGSLDGYLYALTGSTGSVKWSYNTSIYSSPVVDAFGVVYVGTGNGRLYALTAPSSGNVGTCLWYFNAGSSIWSSPTLGDDGKIYFGSHNNNVYALKSYLNPNTTSSTVASTTSMLIKYSAPSAGYTATLNYSLNDGPIQSVVANSSPAQTTLSFFPVSPSPLIWYDGADPLNTGTAPANGTAISRWVNRASPGAYDATVITNSTAATYSTSLKALNFVSTSNYTTGYAPNSSTETIFIIFNTSTTDFANSMLIGNSNVTGGRGITVGNGYATVNRQNAIGMLNQNVAWGTPTPAGSYAYGTTGLAVSVINGTSSSVSINGGTPVTTTWSSPFNINGTTILGQLNAYNYIGYAMEILIYNRVLTTTEIQTVQQYLSAKWILVPPPIPTPTVWYDGADPSNTGTAPANGTAINTWVNKASPGTNNAVAVTAATYSSSLRALTFTGVPNSSGTRYNTGYTSAPTSETVFIVFNSTGTNDVLFNTLFTSTVESGARYITVGSSYPRGGSTYTPNSVGQLCQSVNYNATTSVNTYTSNTTAVATFTISNSGTTTSASVNGNSSNLTTSNVYTSSGTTVLGWRGSDRVYVGYVMEIIIYNRVLNPTEITTVQTYLNNKWYLSNTAPSYLYPFPSLKSYITYTSAPTVYNSVPSLYGGGWPTFQYNNYRTGQAPVVAHSPSLLPWNAWVYKDGTASASFGSPIIGPDGTVYFASSTGLVYAVNGSSGILLWKTQLAAPLVSTPAIDFARGQMYVGTRGNLVYALNINTGANSAGLWPVSISNITCSMAVNPGDGSVYFGTDDGYLFSFTPTGSFNRSDVAAATGNVFPCVSAASIDSAGNIYFPLTTTGRIYRFTSSSLSSYTVLPLPPGTWFTTNNHVITSPIIIANDGSIYVIGNFYNQNFSQYAVLYSYSTITGTNRWSVTTYTPSGTPDKAIALGTNGLVYIITFDNTVKAYTTNNGTFTWTYNPNSVTSTSLTVDKNNVVYFGCQNGRIFAVNGTNGALIWYYALTNGDYPVGTVTIGRDGTIYVGSNLGYMYAL